MSEKEPEFVVTDRRKFTLEGDRREDAPQEQEWVPTPILPAKESAPAAASPAQPAGPRAVPDAAPAASSLDAAAANAAQKDEQEQMQEQDQMPQPPTEAESAEAHAVYTASSRQLDEVVRAANPGMQPIPVMDFPHLVQSLYMSALMQMGAGTPEGQQPRLDILGARQTIDMLGVLSEKTAGNLSDEETAFLQSALFELRMGFLEITQAIARNARQQAQSQTSASDPKPPGKPTLVR